MCLNIVQQFSLKSLEEAKFCVIRLCQRFYFRTSSTSNDKLSKQVYEQASMRANKRIWRIFGLLLGLGRLIPCSVILDKADPWHPIWRPGFHSRCCDEFLREACIVDAVFGTIQIFVCNGHLLFWQWHSCHKKKSFCLLHGGRFQGLPHVWWLYDAFVQTKSCVVTDVHCYTVCRMPTCLASCFSI